jgi:hypothetical protein
MSCACDDEDEFFPGGGGDATSLYGDSRMLRRQGAVAVGGISGLMEPGGVIDDVLAPLDDLVAAGGGAGLDPAVRSLARSMQTQTANRFFDLAAAAAGPVPPFGLLVGIVDLLSLVVSTCSVSGAVRRRAQQELLYVREWQNRTGVGGMVRGGMESILPGTIMGPINGMIDSGTAILSPIEKGNLPSAGAILVFSASAASAVAASGALSDSDADALSALLGSLPPLTLPIPDAPEGDRKAALRVAIKRKAREEAADEIRERVKAAARIRTRAAMAASAAAVAAASQAKLKGSKKEAFKAKVRADHHKGKANRASRAGARANATPVKGATSTGRGGLAGAALGLAAGFALGGPIGAPIGAGIGYFFGRNK